MTTYNVAHDDIGLRLDHVLLTKIYHDQSRSYVQHLIKDGHITLNGLTVKTGQILKSGDVIEMKEVEVKTLDIEAVNLNLDIVYEDDDLAVINKPSGLIVHPASTTSEATLVHGLLHQMDELSSINGVKRPGIVHRIDKDTSGLLVVAKNDFTHQALSEDLQVHDILRVYVALVYGQFKENEGYIDAPIARHAKNRLKMAVISSGKPAKTHFKVLERFDRYTLLELKLETGRTHQIRVHMAYIGHPVVGDPVYGPKEVVGNSGQYLHAKTLSFMHPTKKEQMTFTAELPLEFQQLIKELRRDSVL
jgi:23S rRNA pseudouridine1911/1915/1917 synthase